MGRNEGVPAALIRGTNGWVFHSELMTQPQRFVRVCSPQHFCTRDATYRRAPPFAPKGGCLKKLVTYMQASSVATGRLSS